MEIYFLSSFFISLAIIVYVYVGYPCLLVILNFVIVRKKKGLVEGRVEPFVTLIISAFNEEGLSPLIEAMCALAQAKGKKYL